MLRKITLSMTLALILVSSISTLVSAANISPDKLHDLTSIQNDRCPKGDKDDDCPK